MNPLKKMPVEKAKIHPSAIVETGAQLGEGVEIGPFSYVGSRVKLGDRVKIRSHVVVEGNTEIGDETEIYAFAAIGSRPQDKKYHGENSQLIIGKQNVIREYVTMQPGTEQGGMQTIVGDGGLFMAGVHIAHDCVIGNHVIFANYATLGGHVQVEDFAIIGGLSGIHQFTKIGAHAIIGGMSAVEHDVLPYALVKGGRASMAGLNLVGLRRRGFSAQTIETLMKAYDALFAEGDSQEKRLENVYQKFGHIPEVQLALNFIRSSTRGLCAPRYVDGVKVMER